MKGAREIQIAIQKLAGTFGIKPSSILLGEVQSIDENNRQCSVLSQIDAGTITYDSVNLSAERNDGLLQLPAVGSTVIMVKFPDGDLYVIGWSDLDKFSCFIDSSNHFDFDTNGWVWNGGTLGGLVKVVALTTKLNNLENKLNDLITGINTWVPSSGDGGAALKISLATWLASSLTPTIRADIENTKIKQ